MKRMEEKDFMRENTKGKKENKTSALVEEEVYQFELEDKKSIVNVMPDLQISMETAKRRANLLEKFVQEMMLEGVDYGVIPGVAKPTLFKAGAEKLSDIFGFSKHVQVLNRKEDWDNGLFHYEIKAILLNKKNGVLEAEGIGSCNTKEKKFKNNHPYTMVNTVLKMAKKRAIVDAVLTATRSSGLFTQDVEDLEGAAFSEKLNEETKQAKAASKKQLNFIVELVSQKGISYENAKKILQERYGITDSKELDASQASDFIQHLMEQDKQEGH